MPQRLFNALVIFYLATSLDYISPDFSVMKPRIFSFLFYLIITLLIGFIYENGVGTIPPPGKFFDPFQGFWKNAERSRPEYPKELHFPELKGDVKIIYDDRLVPHVFAKHEYDLYFMQGYVTARHRLWQMDMQTRAASGRLSEVAGKKALKTDMQARRTGLHRAAMKSAEMILKNPQSKLILNAYTDGVNALIKTLDPAEWPMEYKLLNFNPEPWSPYKTALLLKYMANILTSNENDFENTNAVKLFGYKVFDELFPNMPDTLFDPVIPIGTKFPPADYTPNAPEAGLSAFNIHTKSPLNRSSSQPSGMENIEKQDPGLGSNNWAISGSRTASGKPILCNDPHLSLNLPSIWFEIQLNGPGINAYGVSIPGTPCILSGFNDSIAWGITNAYMDVRDWYAIQFRDKGKNLYLFDDKWLPTKKFIETYKIKGEASVNDTIVYTHFGPVPYDEKFNKGHETIQKALRWTAHEPGNELLTFYLLNKGKSFSDYQLALKNYVCPAQNFVFASATGDIAIKQQGLFVNRYKDQGRFVMDGTTGETKWQRYIPEWANPAIKNPERGWVSSANQHPADTFWPYYYSGNYEFFRNRRINQKLNQFSKATIKDMMYLQNDNFNLYASESLPILINHLKGKLTASEKKVLKDLQSWNYFNEPNASAPIYFEEWWKEFKTLLWDEFSAKDFQLSAPGSFFTILFLQKKKLPEFIDNLNTPKKENIENITIRSFKNAMKTIEKWKEGNKEEKLTWSNFKNTSILHLSQQMAFSFDHIPIGGNSGIVNAASSRNGPSWRMVVSPGMKGEAYGIYPGGQSGNPGSHFYANFIAKWVKGEYYRLLFLKPDEKNSRILFIQHAQAK